MVFNINLDNRKVDEGAFRSKVITLVDDILHERFNDNYEKQNAIVRGERLNFACPYCGDSYSDSHKKRANIYYNGYGFHCYNCGTHVGLDKFLNDFHKSIDPSEKVFLHEINEQTTQRRMTSAQKSFEYYIDFDLLKKYAIDKKHIKRFYHLVEIEQNDKIKSYLEGRYQTDFNKFAYDPKNDRLFIFNLIDDNNLIGFQIRNFNREPKYVTHNLTMIYSRLGLLAENQEEFEEANKLSFCYGLNTADFTRDVIVTEGPLDSFLIDNGMCMCGLKNKFPFDLSNVKYMYDYDEPGTEKSIEMAKKGEKVFLWKKYISDSHINTQGKKLDWTDVIKIKRAKGEEVLDPRNYFTESKYDLYYIA